MAIYHCSVKIIGRSSGRSSVGSAAYRAGDNLYNEYDGLTHDYTRKGGIAHAQILLPTNAPASFADRQTLWNAVEKIEKGGKAQLAREVEVALPAELTPEEQTTLVLDYAQRAFVDRGMVADVAIHDKGDGNPHAHIMLTVRALDEQGKWLPKKQKEYILDANGNKQYDPKKKTYKCKTITTTDWNERENMEVWREQWATACNQAFERKGLAERIDHRSYERQGIDQEPTVHLGYVASIMEKRGRQSRRGDLNREVAASNEKYAAELEQLQTELAEIQAQLAVPPAQDVAGRMAGLFDSIVAKEIEIHLNREQRKDIASAAGAVKSEKDTLEEQGLAIREGRSQVKRLQGKLDGLGLFARREKKETEAQLARAKEGRDNAVLELRRVFGIKPGGIEDKQAKLDDELKKLKDEYDALPTQDALKQEKTALLEQYRQAYEQLAGHPDAAAILEQLAAHRPPEVKNITAKLAGFRMETRLREEFPLGRPAPKPERHQRRERGGWEMEM